MITKFKIFESICELPKVGDYIIFSDDWYSGSRKVYNYFQNCIGQVIEIEKRHKPYDYKIKYENVPKEIINLCDDYNRSGDISDDNIIFKEDIHKIKYWSSNREDLEQIISMKNFNL